MTRRPLVYAAVGAAFAVMAVNREDLWGPLGACDIDAAWSAGRALLAHQNPYDVIGPARPYHYNWPFVYPLTVGALALPLAVFPFQVARVVFLLIMGGVFGYAIGATRPWAWPLILSEPFINSVRTVQWAPLLAAGLLLPAWGSVAAIKPNLALALLAGARSRTQVVAMGLGAIGLLGVSLLLRPSWPAEWLQVIRAAPNFDPLVLRPAGFLLLLGLLRWRDPDARLLLAMGLIPQTGFWYDALPALLVARTYRQTLVLSVLSQVAFQGTRFIDTGDFASGRHIIGTLVLWGILMPALALVLRRSLGRPIWVKRSGDAVPGAPEIETKDGTHRGSTEDRR